MTETLAAVAQSACPLDCPDSCTLDVTVEGGRVLVPTARGKEAGWRSLLPGKLEDTWSFVGPEGKPNARLADGVLSFNSAAVTDYRELSFRMDPAETKNSIDDDGDGMIDEGSLVLAIRGSHVALIRNVESCRIRLDGRVLRIALKIASVGSAGKIKRYTMRRSYYLRNN